MKKEIDIKILSFMALTMGIFLLGINFLFVKDEQLFAILNLTAGIIVVAIPLIYKYGEFRKIRQIESAFPKYLGDIAENISAGMTLPQAMRSVDHIDYGMLSKHVKDISSKISWGVPFEKVMQDFARKTRSKLMGRNVQTIIETHRSGGSMDTVLRSVAQSLVELEKIKKERSASVYSQMINGYVIYVVFLGVMVGLSAILVPAFQLEESTNDLQAAFAEIFAALIIIQGFFAGMSIGKMSEGTFVAGVKHAMVLVIVGYTVFILFG
jgi:flagellar protein FlaJ